MSDEAVELLREIRDLLRKQEKPQADIPLGDFCKRLGRSIYWGYEQVRISKIIPAKTGKRPYMVPVAQLANFK